ncbi:hypothetical protein DSO57_1008624 [Entomophthora muscae]|uniref:Uncharacterized protein n=2 Tax=Entomophthora muscae TaxID=34485 RepID=A0ACC2TV43_9FUNG|nr:hypothetical protein DSO57_1033718 [Entomophthora muscae]KAJ9078236.1 hypothetical protein DSO57_1008624 [Entomophthora muscae]
MKPSERRESMLRLTANHERASLFDDVASSRSKASSRLTRAMCFCCSSPLGALFAAIFSLLLLAACGLLTFFLIPRVPSIFYRDLTYSDGSPINELATLSPASNGTLTIPLLINFDISSDNYVDIKINRVDLIGVMQGIPVGQGSLSSPLTIVGRTTTPIALPFTLKYNLLDTSQTNRATIKLLNSSCSPNPNKRKALNIDYHADLALEVLSWTHVIPNIRNTFHFVCPWDIASLL